jgi:hypothetical protein
MMFGRRDWFMRKYKCYPDGGIEMQDDDLVQRSNLWNSRGWNFRLWRSLSGEKARDEKELKEISYALKEFRDSHPELQAKNRPIEIGIFSSPIRCGGIQFRVYFLMGEVWYFEELSGKADPLPQKFPPVRAVCRFESPDIQRKLLFDDLLWHPVEFLGAVSQCICGDAGQQ